MNVDVEKQLAEDMKQGKILGGNFGMFLETLNFQRQPDRSNLEGICSVSRLR